MTSSTIDEFLFPSHVVRAAGASRRAGELLKARGVAAGTVVLVADKMVHEHGLTKAVIAGLEEAGYTPHVFAEIAGEPTLEVVEKAVAEAANASAVAFVGFGGGSALDTAKLVAYASVSPLPAGELKGPVAQVIGFPPLVMIPTTVGTGAEATRVAMFSVDGAKRAVLSPQFVPAIAMLDSDLVAGLPSQVVAATALDALSHAVESMMSSNSNELTWLFAGEAARRVLDRLPAACDGDQDARGDLLYASFLAGVALNAGVVLGHSLSYALAARHDLPHGVGCALALPYCLAYNQHMPASQANALAVRVLGREDATLRDVAVTVRQLTQQVGLRIDLTDTDSHEADIQALAETVVRDYPRPTNPSPLEVSRLATLLTHLRVGDLPGAWLTLGEQS